MAEALDHLKKDYRARFCHGGGDKIDLQQGQNLMKLIQDCFESCNSDLKTNSPSCSTLILKNEEGTSVQSQRVQVHPKPESASSVKRARKSADPSPTSLLKPVSSRGHSCESHLKPATHDHVAASKKPESSVSKSEKKSTIKDEALCQHPAVLLGSEYSRESARSPFPVEEVKNSPVVKLHFDNWSMPATAESHAEVENLEGPQPGREEQVVPVQGAECFVTSSAQSEKPFSSAVLATVATRTLGQRYSTSISPPSPCPVKHQDIEIEDECEFLIDESNGASSWISISTKNKKSKSDGSAIPISKSQPSEKEKTQNKKVKNRKVQVKAHTKQKLDHLDVGTFDFKEMSESDPIPESEESVLTSQSQKSTRMGKTKKDALRQDSPNQKKSGLETKPSYEEQCKTWMLPSEDLPMPSCGHQEEQTVSLKKSLRSSKNQQLASKASQDLDEKEQTTKEKLPRVEVAKRRQLQREELSDSESSEEELEREPLKLNKVCTTPLHQELETPVIEKLTKSKKPGNVLHAPESPVGANTATPLEALQHPMESVKNPEKKWLSAKSAEKIPRKIPCRASKALCSSSEDTGSQTDIDSSSVQDMPRKKPKLPDVKIKSNKRKQNRRHGPQDSFVAEKAVSCKSGPAQEDYDKFASSTESPGQDDTSSDNSEDLNYKLRHLLSDEIARHKIVMPSNTPNVRRTKRIRLRPLEYWRGERINYTMDSSGGLVISGLVHPETESPRKSKKRKKDHPKQERDETSRNTDFFPLDTYKSLFNQMLYCSKIFLPQEPDTLTGDLTEELIAPLNEELQFCFVFVSSGRRETPASLEHSFFVSSDRGEIPASLEHSLADASNLAIVLDPVTNREVPLDCINIASSGTSLLKSEAVEIYKDLNTSLFATGILVLKPHKEKGQQCVSTDTVAFRIIRGKVLVTLHKASYYLAAGDCFYIPSGNKYSIRNLLNEDSVFFFTQIKDR
ncbi:PREDICTED: centromere protein C [Sturnus vulgaris]|uniref:centromere protein C n=1 Tax=Sturnus vulgaris TaxID=9172 RepID=UPI00071A9413|nr:PREDICTED: centromere protein C [Sturnus vulgaris]